MRQALLLSCVALLIASSTALKLSEVSILTFATSANENQIIFDRPDLAHYVSRLHTVNCVNGGKTDTGKMAWTCSTPNDLTDVEWQNWFRGSPVIGCADSENVKPGTCYITLRIYEEYHLVQKVVTLFMLAVGCILLLVFLIASAETKRCMCGCLDVMFLCCFFNSRGSSNRSSGAGIRIAHQE